MDYEPRPIDTSQITLTPQILQLTEVLARNAHDIWARQRFADGWRYSPRRDDHRKEPPLSCSDGDAVDGQGPRMLHQEDVRKAPAVRGLKMAQGPAEPSRKGA